MVNVMTTVSPGDAVTDVGVTVTVKSGAPAEATVTRAVCVAVSPPGSRAVTVMVALPAETPDIVTVESETEALATLELEEVAEYVSASPSGSLK